MSKKYKAQASSARAASSFSGGFGGGFSFQTNASPLAYVTEGPDLTLVTQPNVVVAFKNLSKKDSTTKAKALEEIADYCSSGECEQGVLTAWCDIYPRTAIDNSRKVRQLAHKIQGTLTNTCGKRIAPLLPKVVGSWLAGTFDNDKVVTRAAQDALEKAFPTIEKRKALWKVYREALIHYTEDAILIQTEKTLSDERTTSPDEAEAKHVRVVGSGIHILAQLLADNAPVEAVSTFLSDKKLWDFVTHSDPFLRKALCQLVRPGCKDYSAHLDWKVLSSSFVAKGLQSNQVGSSMHFIEALIILTEANAGIWTTEYTSKTAVSKRLLQFLRKGSQSGPDRVWPAIQKLMELIPPSAWLSENKVESRTVIIEAVRTGVSQSSERINAMTAWTVYTKIGFWLLSQLDGDKTDFANANLVPVVFNYVALDQKQRWSVPSHATRLCAGVISSLADCDCEVSAAKAWTDVVDATNNAMKMSLPESSKDFRSSQDAVIAQASRLFQVRDSYLSLQNPHSSMVALIKETQTQMLQSALDLLAARNGKPYAAASIANSLVRYPGFDINSPTVQEFISNQLPRLFNSPSIEHLISLSLGCGRIDVLEDLLLHETATESEALRFLLKHATEPQISPQLQSTVEKYVASLSDPFSQTVAKSIMSNQSLKMMHNMILSRVQDCLSLQESNESQQGGLTVLEDILASPESGRILTSGYRQSLLSTLLVLSDTDNDNAERARLLVSKMDAKVSDLDSTQHIVQQQLNGAGSPLSIFTLIELAINSLKKGTSLSSILPTQEQWQNALRPFSNAPRPVSLAITNPLQGIVYCLETSTPPSDPLLRDLDSLSMAFRLALYTTKLLTPANVISTIDTNALKASQHFLPIIMELINEKLTDERSNDIWLQGAPELIQEAADVLSDGNRIIQSWLEEDDEFVDYWISRAHSFEDISASTYCEASAWVHVMTQLVDQSGPSSLLQRYEQDLKHNSKSSHPIKIAAILAVLRDHIATSGAGKRICNELIAKATETKSELQPLILMNIFLNDQGLVLGDIPTQRVVFLMKNVLGLLQEPDEPGLEAECVKLLCAIIPAVSDIYGEHWDLMLEYIGRVWQTDASLPLINATLRLYSKLLTLCRDEDINEDLSDAFKARKQDLDEGLLNCLSSLGSNESGTDQPRDITSELLRRLLKNVVPQDPSVLLSLLSSRVEAVQNASYDVLHRTIPEVQEQLSIDLVLEKKVLHLPEGLIVLLEDSSNPKQYLLAWNLAFDHFSKAAFVLREHYTNDIKESNHLDNLLDFICEVLRITSGRAIDASKFDISTFNTDGQESFEKDLQHLSIYTYHNILLFVPSLAKEWFISQKNRIKSPLESWTQKYISPSIISTSVSNVTEWAAAQTDDDRPLEIKSSPRGTELVASIEIDPENAPISLAVALPGSYPLESPSVTSRTRVGVSEKNWQSWLRTIQIIIFSTGSIIEGLIAFRHNVQGALKGQSECAICYSIIGTDKQTPNKKCNTCKNTFHGSCLYRWFKSSNSSSCPLCRNNFNYA